MKQVLKNGLKSNSLLVDGLIEDIDVHKIIDSVIIISRQTINDDEDKELVVSIKQKGLLQPIIVRPKQTEFEIVAGNRRLFACKKLGWKKIACHVVDVDDKEAFEISLSENLQRKTLTPIEEAEAFKNYVTDVGYGGVSELASKVGKSPSYITKRIKLLNLHPAVIDCMNNSSIHTSLAEELSYVKDKSKQPTLASLISEGRLSVKETRGLVKNLDSQTTDMSSELWTKKRVTGYTKKRHDALNKSIIVLRIATVRIGMLIDTVEDDWLIREILMQHKNAVSSQVDLLIKEKSKLRHRLPSP